MSTPTPTDLLIGSVKELLETIEPSAAADAVRTALDMLDGGMKVEPDPEPEPDIRDVAARLSPSEDGVVYKTFDDEGNVSGEEVLPSEDAINRLMDLLAEEDVPLVAFREDEPSEFTIFFPATIASESFTLIAENEREVDDGILVWKTATGIMGAVTEAFRELPLDKYISQVVNEANAER
jgi:hypothetical protein